MKKFISDIIWAILKGNDYRKFVLAVINERFIRNVNELTEEIFLSKKQYGDCWIHNLLEETKDKKGKWNKFKLLWYGGLNDKTVKNMTGSSAKDVCLEVGKENIDSVNLLLKEMDFDNITNINITLKRGNEKIELNELESILFVNIISTMKLTVQGGAWSEVGKNTEKQLLFTIFRIFEIPSNHFILVYDDMKRKGLVENREIDGILFSGKERVLQIELKLLGIGNPEIGDEALARKVDLFLIDRLTDMMKKEAEKINVKVIEFRQENFFDEMYDFLVINNIPCRKPVISDDRELKELIDENLEQYNEDFENKKILQKAKELTQ